MSREILRALAMMVALAPIAAPAVAQGEAPRVLVAAAAHREVTDAESFIGRVEAADQVDLIARVRGFLRETAVADGAVVRKGDVLFRIEPFEFEANVDARRADLARAEADLQLRKIELDRQERLVARDAAPQSELDVARANAAVSEAQIAAARAALRLAELDLSYTEIPAPFDGRLGRIAVSTGALVGPDSGPLAAIVREAPVFVSFSVSERQLANLMQSGVARQSTAIPDSGPLVTVTLANGYTPEEVGRIAFGDNRIDPATGSLAVRARFENAEGLLIDGAFVTVRVASEQAVTRLTVPQAAVQRDQRGAFVLVVGPEQTVEQRYIEISGTVETESIVTDGLAAGETVIVEGLQRVRPGVPVSAVMAGTEG